MLGSLNLSIRGNTESIRLLARNNENYQARVTFKNLRSTGEYSAPNADVLKININKIR